MSISGDRLQHHNGFDAKCKKPPPGGFFVGVPNVAAIAVASGGQSSTSAPQYRCVDHAHLCLVITLEIQRSPDAATRISHTSEHHIVCAEIVGSADNREDFATRATCLKSLKNRRQKVVVLREHDSRDGAPAVTLDQRLFIGFLKQDVKNAIIRRVSANGGSFLYGREPLET